MWVNSHSSILNPTWFLDDRVTGVGYLLSLGLIWVLVLHEEAAKRAPTLKTDPSSRITTWSSSPTFTPPQPWGWTGSTFTQVGEHQQRSLKQYDTLIKHSSDRSWSTSTSFSTFVSSFSSEMELSHCLTLQNTVGSACHCPFLSILSPSSPLLCRPWVETRPWGLALQ